VPARFAGRLFGRAADDPIAGKLWAAAAMAEQALSHADLGLAATDLADAQQLVGLDRWPRFLADAEQRAAELPPATTFQTFGVRSIPAVASTSLASGKEGLPDRGNTVLAGSEEEAVPGAALRSLRALQGVEGPGGQWVAVSEGMSARASTYQNQVAGNSAGRAYVVNGVRFDGFNGKVLIEAKGPGYAQWLSGGKFKDGFYGTKALVDQAERQSRVANGFPIEWHVAEPEVASAIRNLLDEARIPGITVINTPLAP
jgi:hypothetical protein